MVIKSQGERDADDEQNGKHCLVAGVGEKQASKVDNQNQKLSGYDVGHDRAHEKSFFALEDYAAGAAAGFYVEGPLND